MLKPRPEDVGPEKPNFGGSTRVKGEPPVLRRLRMPTRFRVGERPAGAERGDGRVTAVLILAAGERAVRVGRLAV